MLDFKAKRAIQKDIKAHYAKLEAGELGFKAKRDVQKSIKELYAKLSVEAPDENSFEAQKKISEQLNKAVDDASYKLNSFPKGEMGLTPDEIKKTDEYKIAKRDYDTAFGKLREFNSGYSKKFKKEIRQAVQDKRDEATRKHKENQVIDPAIIERLSDIRDVLQSEEFTLQDLNGLNRSVRKIEEVESSLLNNDLYNEVIGLYKQAIDSRGVTVDSVDGGLFDTVETDDVTLDKATQAEAEKVKKFVLKRVPSGMQKDINISLSRGTIFITYDEKLTDQQRQILEIGLKNAVKKSHGKLDYTHVSNNNHQWEVSLDSIDFDSVEMDAITSYDELLKTEHEEPTEKQKEAGNYKKPKVKIAGFTISIENIKGSVRKGKDSDGKEWEAELKDSYGYINGTVGEDGDHVDVFLNSEASEDELNARDIFVISQNDVSTGEFDEHKVIFGAKDTEDAKEVYSRNFSKDFNGYGGAKKMVLGNFAKWVSDLTEKQKA